MSSRFLILLTAGRPSLICKCVDRPVLLTAKKMAEAGKWHTLKPYSSYKSSLVDRVANCKDIWLVIDWLNFEISSCLNQKGIWTLASYLMSSEIYIVLNQINTYFDTFSQHFYRKLKRSRLTSLKLLSLDEQRLILVRQSYSHSLLSFRSLWKSHFWGWSTERRHTILFMDVYYGSFLENMDKRHLFKYIFFKIWYELCIHVNF